VNPEAKKMFQLIKNIMDPFSKKQDEYAMIELEAGGFIPYYD